MPRYTKQGRKGNSFRKRFKKWSPAQAQSVLSRLSKEEFEVMKDVARHFKGDRNVYSPHLPVNHTKKIKPSSYGYIIGARHGYDLGKTIEAERRTHANHDIESHQGGGILEAFNVVGNYVWELYNPLPDSVKWAAEKFVGRESSRNMSKSDKNNADLVGEAYNDVGSRVDSLDGYTRLPEYDTKYSSVWKDQDGNLSVAIRGSKTFKDFMWQDPGILFHGKPDDRESETIQQYLISIAKDHPDVDLTVNSHSLSGAFVQQAFQSATPEEAEWLDHYHRINQYNPGASPFVGTDDIKEFTADPRVYLYLNRTDMVSSTYNAVLPDNYDRVTYGQSHYNPLDAHSIGQWSNQQQDPNSLVHNEPTDDFNAMHTVMEAAYMQNNQDSGGFWSSVGNVVSGIADVFHDANMAPEISQAAEVAEAFL